ncbi:MAG: V-type ATP synthase subunit D [Prolixibacteraceae bacterium]|nr:V-type ATP synthase subunit D [Prolixibacteraceae bacterium]
MSINYQFNKTSLQLLEKQLKVRVKALPTIKNKESALRMEVKKTKNDVAALEILLEQKIGQYENMVMLWSEFNSSLIKVTDVRLITKKVAGVKIPILDGVDFSIEEFSLFNNPQWYSDGIELLKEMARIGIEHEFLNQRMMLFEHARKKTTQKVNLFEKVQIPGYDDAIRKIKRFMEDEENLSKSSQKIVKERQQNKEEEL